MRKIARVDSNQAEIVDALRKAGARVWDCHRYGGGFPDLLILYHGAILLIEVKSKGGRMTEEEQVFYNEYQEGMVVVYSAEEALEAIARL
jgi:hypothetical protein